MFRAICFFFILQFILSCSQQDRGSPSPEIRVSQSSALGDLPNQSDRPTISHVRIVDLDQDGLLDVLVCDVLGQKIGWIHQTTPGVFIEQSLHEGEINAPVHVEAVDIDFDGDLDVLIAAMGVILPSDAHLGQVLILENDGNETFTKHVIANNVQRVTDVQAGDLDGDGDLDLAVAHFGYTQGQVQWFRNEGDWNFSQNQLIDRSGAIHAPIVDIDNDGDLDILALLSQEWETVYAFINDGHGIFTTEILHDVADSDFSSSGIAVVDLDQDGDADVLWTNGDAFVAVDYRPLPTHGVQWLENKGNLEFEYHRIGQMDGAYGPSAADMDNDGDLDIVTVAEFAFWDEADTRSVVWWEQQQGMRFVPHTFAISPTHLVTCDVGDLDGNGWIDIVAGGMALYPPFDRITRVTHWLNEGKINKETHTVKNPLVIQLKLDSATSAGHRGMILHANGLDPRHEYQEAIEADPENPRWPYYLGMIDVAVGDSSSALSKFEHAESLDDTYSPLKTRLGELYVGIGDVERAKEKFMQANTDHAIVALAQLEASLQHWTSVLQLLKGHENPAAVSLARTANAKLNNTPHQPYIAVDMGYQMDDPWLVEVEEMCILAPHLVTQAQTDFIAGNLSSAETLLRRAIEIDPANKDARLALATILLRGDRANNQTIAESIVHLEAGLQSDPEYVMTRAKYGWALYLSQRFDEARKVWISILEDEPNHGPAFANLAQLELSLKHYDNAYAYFKRAFEVPEDSPFALSQDPTFQSETLYRFSLAAKQAIGKSHEAVSLLEQAILLAPSNPVIQFELANNFIGQKKFEEALPHIEFAHALQPRNPRILAALGYTWFNLNNPQLAIEFFEQSVKLAPTFALAWFHLGTTQELLGDISAARESFEVAVQLQPTFTAAKQALLKLEGR